MSNAITFNTGTLHGLKRESMPGPYMELDISINGEYAGSFSGYADARASKLIAAAPELLEAAKRALNYCINSQREVGIADGSDEELDTTKLLRAAIAKATGAQS